MEKTLLTMKTYDMSAKTGYIYFNYYSEEFLSQILEGNGFKIFKLLRQNYQEHDGSITTDMFFFACKV